MGERGQAWSFDDLHIGQTNGTSLSSRVIQRPAGLANSEWYQLAAQVCAALADAGKEG